MYVLKQFTLYSVCCFPISVQFEGGLLVTAKVVYATYALSEFLGKAPAITEVCGIYLFECICFVLFCLCIDCDSVSLCCK